MRVHIHTDSPFFSGAENMIATLLCDEDFVADFDVTLSYRASRQYEEGISERLAGTRARLLPLELLDVPARTGALPSPIRVLAKIAAYATAAKWRYLRVNRRRLRALFAENRPDLVHVNSGGYPGAYSTLAAVLAAKDAGVPHVIYVANNIATRYTWRRAFERSLDLRVAGSVDVFVTGSRFAGTALASLLALPPGKVRAIPNGIRPRAVRDPAADVRARIGVPPDRPLVVVVANLEKRKGHAHLLRALAQLRRDGAEPLPWLAIEGTGPERDRLTHMVASLGLAHDVAFLGRQSDVFDLMNASDIVALPSIANEDFPNVVLEAASLGRPVVASRIAGTPEQIVDGETGILVPPGDDRALATALATLAASPELRVRLGDAAGRRFEQRYTAAHAVLAYRELYAQVAEGSVVGGAKR